VIGARGLLWAAGVAGLAAGLMGLPSHAAQSDRVSLSTLEMAGYVDVSLDTSRFKAEKVATIKITNRYPFRIEGRIPACSTVFASQDRRVSPLRPGEPGAFVVGPNGTVLITRPFRLVDPGKTPPDGATYALSDSIEAEPDCKE
jgi:hypothetical protein